MRPDKGPTAGTQTRREWRRAGLILSGPVLVWGLTLFMGYDMWRRVAAAATPIPYWDEWAWAPYAIGSYPVTSQWIWAQHNEHRIPAAKLFALAYYRVTGGDSRHLWLLHVGLLSAITVVFILTVKRLRGRTLWVDALFPLLYLHLGHWENTFSCGSPSLFSAAHGVVLASMVATLGESLSQRRAWLIGFLVAAAPVVGMGVGVFVGAAMGAWLLFCAATLFQRSRGRPGQGAAVLVGFGLLTCLCLVAYRHGWKPVVAHPPSAGLPASLRTSLEWGSTAFGARGASEGLGAPVAFTLISVLVATTIGLLAWYWFRRPADRLRTGALFTLYGTYVVVGLAVGWGRSGFGSGYFASRYAVHAAPLVSLAFLAWEIAGPRPIRRIAQGLMLGALLVASPANHKEGADFYARLARITRTFTADVTRGMPLADLALRYDGCFHPPNYELFLHNLGVWEAARQSVFRKYRPQPGPFWLRVWSLKERDLVEGQWDGLEALNQVNLRSRDGALVIKATGNYPAFLLPAFPLPGPVALDIEVSSPSDTSIAVLCATSDRPFYSAGCTTARPLVSGKNRRRFVVFDPDLQGGQLIGRLRVDLGTSPGRYIVHSLAVDVGR